MTTLNATREQVAAAMIAVVAEKGADYRSDTSTLNTPEGKGCIQGAMLGKLGYQFKPDEYTHGATDEVMEMLGMSLNERAVYEIHGHQVRFDGGAQNTTDPLLYEALSLAQYANDRHLAWGFALELFEGVLAGRMDGQRRLEKQSRKECAENRVIQPMPSVVFDEFLTLSKVAQQVAAKMIVAFDWVPAYQPKTLTWEKELQDA